MNKIRKKALEEEKEKCVRKIASLDIEIKVLEETPPNSIVAEQVLKRDERGNPMSKREITAQKLLSNHQDNRKGLMRRLSAIEELLDE